MAESTLAVATGAEEPTMPPAAIDWVLSAVRACESPIETALLVALMSQFPAGGIDIVNGAPAFGGHRLCPQHAASGFRLDFALVPLPWAKGKPIAIECDGHDFHEKTPEQAARDKARDRALTEAGWTMLRFTGREIHRDSRACADQVWRVAGVCRG